MSHLALGLMSGTSCDGISAALARFDGAAVHVMASRTCAYPTRVERSLRRAGALTAAQLSSLNMELGELFGRAALRLLQQARVATRQVAIIGSHGHTVYHGPRDRVPSTLQIGEPAVIAERTGIPVVADFRPRDIAAAGEGAPLVPFFDQTFFGRGPARALQNIGGIANVTVVGTRLTPLAFDTGPGNCLMDLMAARITRGRLRYDPSGRLARSGRIDLTAAARCLRHAYFRRRPPKSTGLELFNGAWLREMFGRRLTTHPLDVLATVTYVTARSIADSYHRFMTHPLREIIVSGGGLYNRTLMEHLRASLAPIPVRSIEVYGIPAQAKEPVAFAYLALRALRGRINHLPRTTGARRARVLGSLTPGRC